MNSKKLSTELAKTIKQECASYVVNEIEKTQNIRREDWKDRLSDIVFSNIAKLNESIDKQTEKYPKKIKTKKIRKKK